MEAGNGLFDDKTEVRAFSSAERDSALVQPGQGQPQYCSRPVCWDPILGHLTGTVSRVRRNLPVLQTLRFLLSWLIREKLRPRKYHPRHRTSRAAGPGGDLTPGMQAKTWREVAGKAHRKLLRGESWEGSCR